MLRGLVPGYFFARFARSLRNASYADRRTMLVGCSACSFTRDWTRPTTAPQIKLTSPSSLGSTDFIAMQVGMNPGISIALGGQSHGLSHTLCVYQKLIRVEEMRESPKLA